MSKKIQLSIPKPCHESWDAMTPVEQGKFCGSCQKQVVDFSTMSDRQVAEFFKKPTTGSVCGRFMTDQLQRDIEIPKKRIPWFKYFFQIALPAFLVSIKATSAKAQGEIRVKTTNTDTTKKPPVLRPKMGLVAPTICVKPPKGEVMIMGDIEPAMVTKLNGTIQLKVVDEKGEAVPYASIITGVIGKGGAADKNGLFKLDKGILDVNGHIFISSAGYERKEVRVRDFSNLIGTFTVVLQEKGWLKEVMVTCSTIRMGAVVRGTYVTSVADQEVKGKVIDEKGDGVPFASVIIKGTKTGVMADQNGEFLIRPQQGWDKLSLVGSAIDLVTTEVVVDKGSLKGNVIIRMQALPPSYDVGVIVIKQHKKNAPIPLIPDISLKKSANGFTVFPNPVDAGANLNIEWKQTDEGYHTLQMLNESGQSVYQQEIWIDAEARTLSIHVPQMAAGNYFVVLINKKTGKKFTGKIVVQ
ncbi:MAG: T9SS type A sorting domain-containing protein [Chitinophagaceae bacterium]|nr:T9SS type A sorting domain-containing protein [Chitinophagaceae bacterium]